LSADKASKLIASVKGSTHLGLACDLVQAAHAYTADKELGNKMIKVQQDLLDIADAFRRAR